MKILGIRYGGHDSAASLMLDGKIVFAIAEERLDLQKHSRNFPTKAIDACLNFAGLSINEIDEIAFANDPIHHINEFYLKPAIGNSERISFLINDIDRLKQAVEMEAIVRDATGFEGPVTFHRHHLCHLASAWYPSGFPEAVVISLDGMGEMETGTYAVARNGALEVVYNNTFYPDSLGLIYSAITFYLGWKHHCDEGIIMGLASYGDPHQLISGHNKSYYDVFCEIIKEESPYAYTIVRDWIVYDKIRDTWMSQKFYDLFGPKRKYTDPITIHHQNIAAALQLRLETIVLGHLAKLREEFAIDKLCIAGGVGLNCSLNGKIEQSGIFKEIFVQPASGDDGSTLGVCFLAAIKAGLEIYPEKQHNYYLGSEFRDDDILGVLEQSEVDFYKSVDIYSETAQLLADGRIVAWFQGRSEFGPRALGNRSILTRPFPADMKDYLNNRVKFREDFRPFAPAVLSELTEDYFSIKQESPYMLIASNVKPEKTEQIPAVVHVDGTCRVQSVSHENNPRFRNLLEAFNQRTGVPVLLNTSFNVKGQPIVNTPEQAIACFKGTNIDCLVMGDYLIKK